MVVVSVDACKFLALGEKMMGKEGAAEDIETSHAMHRRHRRRR